MGTPATKTNLFLLLVGLSIPKLLPITGTFALPLSIYYIFLQLRVSMTRLNTNKTIEPKSSDDADDYLLAASRSQMNFAENVPLALAVAGIVELNGGSRKVLTAALSALCVARVLHSEFGLMAKGYIGLGRRVGHIATQAVVGGLSGYAAYLVKGYWGF